MIPMRQVALCLLLVLSLPFLAYGNGKGKWVRKEVKGNAPEFRLTNIDGKNVSLKDLRGKVTLVSFIYTTCTTGCLVVTAKMKDVQKAFKDKPFSLVSISFDPAHDTPEAMKEYAKRFGVDLSNWYFLTGPPEIVENVLFDYKIEVSRVGKKGPSGEVVSVELVDHGVKSYVIDKTGAKRFEYWGQDFDTKVAIKDITKVMSEGQ
ncbi:MAG TPA: SCO family protein [Candidatus Binatia bacterium]|jgi:protein SCO1/2